MIEIRPGASRGHANHGWLDSWHSFSFADYFDPAQMGWGSLRVINDDTVAAGAGFPTHGHRDMEIISIVLEGALEHRDSMGNGTVIRPGEVQRMSAGTGVTHSEFNPSQTERTRFLQIWIRPRTAGGAPGYEQKNLAPESTPGRWCLVASPDGRSGSVTVNQDASLFACVLDVGESISAPPTIGRLQYMHVISGSIRANGISLAASDGAKIRDEAALDIHAKESAKFLLFDLAEA